MSELVIYKVCNGCDFRRFHYCKHSTLSSLKQHLCHLYSLHKKPFQVFYVSKKSDKRFLLANDSDLKSAIESADIDVLNQRVVSLVIEEGQPALSSIQATITSSSQPFSSSSSSSAAAQTPAPAPAPAPATAPAPAPAPTSSSAKSKLLQAQAEFQKSLLDPKISSTVVPGVAKSLPITPDAADTATEARLPLSEPLTPVSRHQLINKQNINAKMFNDDTAPNNQENVAKIVSEAVSKVVDAVLDIQKKASSFSSVSPAPSNLVVHPRVYCDGCKKPVHGVRYKCGHCPDFDFCEECEAKVEHTPHHLFIKIKNPIMSSFGSTPLLRPFGAVPPVCSMGSKKGSSNEIFSSDCSSTTAITPATSNASKSIANAHNTPPPTARTVPVLATGCLRRENASQPSCVVSPYKNMRRQHQKELDVLFVRDETIPDGTIVAPGSRFKKCWLIRNNGTKAWPKGTFATNTISGSLTIAPDCPRVDLGDLNVSPGQDVEISIDFIAPTKVGRYTSHWRLGRSSPTSTTSELFGHRFWCDVVVSKAEPASPSSSSSIACSEAADRQTFEAAAAAAITAASDSIDAVVQAASETFGPGLKAAVEFVNEAVTAVGKDYPEPSASVCVDPASAASASVAPAPVTENSLTTTHENHEESSKVASQAPATLDSATSTANAENADGYIVVKGDGVEESDFDNQFDGTEINDEISTLFRRLDMLLAAQPNEDRSKDLDENSSFASSLPSVTFPASAASTGASTPLLIDFSSSVSSSDAGMPTQQVLPSEKKLTAPAASGKTTSTFADADADVPSSAAAFNPFDTTYFSSSPSLPPHLQQQSQQHVSFSHPVATTIREPSIPFTDFKSYNSFVNETATIKPFTPVLSEEEKLMKQLFEMGFCDRQTNRKLITEMKGDVSAIVSTILAMSDNDWFTRHHN